MSGYGYNFLGERSIGAHGGDSLDLATGTGSGTTVRNVGAADFVDVGLRNAINAGIVPGPRMLIAGNSLGARGGHCDDDRTRTPDQHLGDAGRHRWPGRGLRLVLGMTSGRAKHAGANTSL